MFNEKKEPAMLLLLATTEWTGSVARNPHLKRTCLHGNSFLSGDQPITMLNLVSAFYSEVRLCSRCVQIKLPSVNDQIDRQDKVFQHIST